MAHIFEYAVLQAIPDARRGERANIGLCVFQREGLDVRLSGISKVRALTGDDWRDRILAAQTHLADCFSSGDRPGAIVKRFAFREPAIRLSEIAWFSVSDLADYEGRVGEILTALVARPRKEKGSATTTRINTEMAREFKRTKVLAESGDDIESHKIVRGFVVSADENLAADFAYKNGRYHIAATLDLRRLNVPMGEAALKAVTLDKAKQRFPDGVALTGVYALGASPEQFKPQLELLKDYADQTFNWLDPEQRRAFMRLTFDSLHQPGIFQTE